MSPVLFKLRGINWANLKNRLSGTGTSSSGEPECVGLVVASWTEWEQPERPEPFQNDPQMEAQKIRDCPQQQAQVLAGGTQYRGHWIARRALQPIAVHQSISPSTFMCAMSASVTLRRRSWVRRQRRSTGVRLRWPGRTILAPGQASWPRWPLSAIAVLIFTPVFSVACASDRIRQGVAIVGSSR
jgi:hypothetical protein